MFKIDTEKITFYEEYEIEGVSYTSSFIVDRYTGFAHEAQSVWAKKLGNPPYSVTGEYQCKKIDKPAF